MKMNKNGIITNWIMDRANANLPVGLVSLVSFRAATCPHSNSGRTRGKNRSDSLFDFLLSAFNELHRATYVTLSGRQSYLMKN
jgi:hypothetical protein